MPCSEKRRLNDLHDTRHFTFLNDRLLDSSKLKQFADNNFEFDENGIELSKRVVNSVGKEEWFITSNFLLFPQCFQGLSKFSYNNCFIKLNFVQQQSKSQDRLVYWKADSINKVSLPGLCNLTWVKTFCRFKQQLFNPLPDDKF